jgi:hypothetical protein
VFFLALLLAIFSYKKQQAWHWVAVGLLADFCLRFYAGAGISPLGSLAQLVAAGMDLVLPRMGVKTAPVWGAGAPRAQLAAAVLLSSVSCLPPPHVVACSAWHRVRQSAGRGYSPTHLAHVPCCDSCLQVRQSSLPCLWASCSQPPSSCCSLSTPGRQAAAAAAAQTSLYGQQERVFPQHAAALSAPTCLHTTGCLVSAHYCLVLPQLQAATVVAAILTFFAGLEAFLNFCAGEKGLPPVFLSLRPASTRDPLLAPLSPSPDCQLSCLTFPSTL